MVARDTASRMVLIHFRPSQTDKQVNDCDRQIIGVVLTAEHRLKDTASLCPLILISLSCLSTEQISQTGCIQSQSKVSIIRNRGRWYDGTQTTVLNKKKVFRLRFWSDLVN